MTEPRFPSNPALTSEEELQDACCIVAGRDGSEHKTLQVREVSHDDGKDSAPTRGGFANTATVHRDGACRSMYPRRIV